MGVDEWVAVVALCLSELVIGSVALKAADTTILLKTLAVFDVAPAVRVRQLWLTRVILLQWILHRIMAWAQDQWQALQAPALSHQLQALDLAVVMVGSTLAVHLAPMLFHPVLVLRLDLILPSILILALLEALTLLVPSTAELPKPHFSPQATDQHQQAHPTTSIPTKVKAIHLHFYLPASVTCQ
jgi:hypothetical protein